jgi:hypothetical protein
VTEYLGWAATGVFVASYFFAQPRALRAVQMLGAAMWIVYGLAIQAAPVVVANVLVCAAAAWTVARAHFAVQAKPMHDADAPH